MKPRKHHYHPLSTLLLLVAASSSLQFTIAAASQLPFQPAATTIPNALVRRQQDGCLTNFYSCETQGGAAFAGICCANGQICSLDASNNPACCPASAVCTGTAPSTFLPPSTSISYVPNAYFSFPYAPTSFADTAACSSAVSACGANYDSCTSRLEGAAAAGGGAAGVTVVVPGAGGTTVVGGQAAGGSGSSLPTASATSICSSLSAAACGGLQSGMCNGAGDVTTGGFVVGTGTGNAAPARQTGCVVGMMVGIGVGVGIVNGL